MSVRVHGIPQTKAALERVGVEIQAAAPKASGAAGDILARAMAARAPRLTGEMASMIGVSVDGETARVGSDSPHARFVQSGTRYMPAQPFMTEAADDSESSIVATIAGVLKAAIH